MHFKPAIATIKPAPKQERIIATSHTSSGSGGSSSSSCLLKFKPAIASNAHRVHKTPKLPQQVRKTIPVVIIPSKLATNKPTAYAITNRTSSPDLSFTEPPVTGNKRNILPSAPYQDRSPRPNSGSQPKPIKRAYGEEDDSDTEEWNPHISRKKRRAIAKALREGTPLPNFDVVDSAPDRAFRRKQIPTRFVVPDIEMQNPDEDGSKSVPSPRQQPTKPVPRPLKSSRIKSQSGQKPSLQASVGFEDTYHDGMRKTSLTSAKEDAYSGPEIEDSEFTSEEEIDRTPRISSTPRASATQRVPATSQFHRTVTKPSETKSRSRFQPSTDAEFAKAAAECERAVAQQVKDEKPEQEQLWD